MSPHVVMLAIVFIDTVFLTSGSLQNIHIVAFVSVPTRDI